MGLILLFTQISPFIFPVKNRRRIKFIMAKYIKSMKVSGDSREVRTCNNKNIKNITVNGVTYTRNVDLVDDISFTGGTLSLYDSDTSESASTTVSDAITRTLVNGMGNYSLVSSTVNKISTPSGGSVSASADVSDGKITYQVSGRGSFGTYTGTIEAVVRSTGKAMSDNSSILTDRSIDKTLTASYTLKLTKKEAPLVPPIQLFCIQPQLFNNDTFYFNEMGWYLDKLNQDLSNQHGLDYKGTFGTSDMDAVSTLTSALSSTENGVTYCFLLGGDMGFESYGGVSGLMDILMNVGNEVRGNVTLFLLTPITDGAIIAKQQAIHDNFPDTLRVIGLGYQVTYECVKNCVLIGQTSIGYTEGNAILEHHENLNDQTVFDTLKETYQSIGVTNTINTASSYDSTAICTRGLMEYMGNIADYSPQIGGELSYEGNSNFGCYQIEEGYSIADMNSGNSCFVLMDMGSSFFSVIENDTVSECALYVDTLGLEYCLNGVGLSQYSTPWEPYGRYTCLVVHPKVVDSIMSFVNYAYEGNNDYSSDFNPGAGDIKTAGLAVTDGNPIEVSSDSGNLYYYWTYGNEIYNDPINYYIPPLLVAVYDGTPSATTAPVVYYE